VEIGASFVGVGELSAQFMLTTRRVARAFETRLATGSPPPTCTISISSRVWPNGIGAPELPAFELFDAEAAAAENETAREACAAKPTPLDVKDEDCECVLEGWGWNLSTFGVWIIGPEKEWWFTGGFERVMFA